MVQRLRPWVPEICFAGVFLVLAVALWFVEDIDGVVETLVKGLLIGIAVSIGARYRTRRRLVGPEDGPGPGPWLSTLWVKPGHGSPLDPAACPVPFSGRDRELALLGEWFDDRDAPPVMVVAGPPGVGKSRLMVEFARSRPAGWRTGRLRPGMGNGLIRLLEVRWRPALVVVEEGDLRDDMGDLLAELRDRQGDMPIRLLVEVRHPGALAPHSWPVLRLGDPGDLDRIFHDALKAFWREPGEVRRPDGPVFEVVAAALNTDPLADARKEAPALAASMLVGARPAVLRRIPELAGGNAGDLAWLAGWTADHAVRPPSLAGRLLGEVAAARPELIGLLTRDLSIPQSRRALWWLALIADGSPEAAEAFLRLAVSHSTLLPRAVCCLVGDGMAERMAALVAAREWTAEELDAVDSPDLPPAVRSALGALT
ncbi:P-loop NTPase family protein [Herbidospora sp. RD11066]